MPKKKGHPELAKLAGQHNFALGRLLGKRSMLRGWEREAASMRYASNFETTKQKLLNLESALKFASDLMFIAYEEVKEDFEYTRKITRESLEKEHGNNS